MSQQNSEKEEVLSRILDMIRMISIVILLLHIYYFEFPSFEAWGLTSRITNAILANIERTGLFADPIHAKMIALGLLIVSLLGARGKKEPRLARTTGWKYAMAGLAIYFGGPIVFLLDFPSDHLAFLYLVVTIAGFILVLTGGNLLSRTIFRRSQKDIFNRSHESFPQEERHIENEYSLHLPAIYQLKEQDRRSWINIINPFRGILVLGSPGSGKTYYVIQEIIKQQIAKGFSMLIYDFKYDDLSRIAYNYFLKYQASYPDKAAYYNINFDDLNRSHRSNPLTVDSLKDISDATESSRTILLGLNMEWVGKQGDFFVESPINFVTALIWFLRNYDGGKYCTWPHVIELAQTRYSHLFSILRTDPQIEPLLTPFINAFQHGAMEQLEGQIASATISLARLSSPSIYYLLTGNDFSLDLNNPEAPKILTLGNNPRKTATYGAILSVYINTINRLANKKGMHPFSEVLEEFSTIIVNTIDKSIATGRSNRITITLCVQTVDQLRLAYGKEFADVVVNLCGNVLCGHATGDTARAISERFSKTLQDRESYTFTANDTHVSQALHLEAAIPPSRIASLSSGEFVGMVADNPDQPIELKSFCCQIQNDHEALREEEAAYKELPPVPEVTEKMLMDNYMQIKADIAGMIKSELERMRNTLHLAHLVIEREQ